MVEDEEDSAPHDGCDGAERIACMDAAVEEVFTSMLRAVCVVTDEVCLEERICATIRVEGEPEGECAVEVPAAAGDRLTDALLGTEGDWDAAMIEDAVGELCNMIAGGIKRRMGIWRGRCRISLPRVRRLGAGELSVLPEGSTRRMYLLDEHTIAVTLVLAMDRWAA